ncbi:ST3 beta-galactoside alpha-2,3-sialyltransferase 8 [Paramormyrops kingsleyae]|uniref:CMP-N-acetylneuraminate-beta-galactosamide-alpha-2,3-sialyltransferase 2 n=1 Tax=Paramormyrops kingsleyae TaxID=1676925 RepID=A0A3B3TCL2_9TELE|nr:CMP-N-acetylneuraminate-beta-galactosamide-alpha-2,3-sialyltransferase 2-like [Paramormyrops kingsleyae]XP_023693607.1 CMP-N-acetylneuraminate-beta-galactosamide-alpha-2,3-sialyltransferase 2-like [Paramormyrops kingsleyae]XP_023693608.1 CMP-N-acetylneuraminate-beta-galactosamide-alpha-2,3-sialyltransferase 2-like [Paramormyrops kingsleyae]XP_023693609.1 CMP-N-acetylneuraminate-beta-galactosamide-alpha-2,3-sialyltransferase 2-like [Paramormyrops kingsleyae]XP_023693610.1 CMP-N-acetylneuramin
MLSRMKLYLCAVLCCILLVIIATHIMQRGALSPVLAANATTAAWNRICGCSSCVGETDNSEWFKEHFDPEQQPFLMPNGNITPPALSWWLLLQRPSVGLDPEEVIQKMFKVISAPPLYQRRNLPSRACRRCAVVGNSGNLARTHFGKMIDSHNIVIRMNRATTLGFEVDVGSKTTHHFMYPESAVDLSPGVHLILLPFKLRDLQWVASALSTGKIKTTYMRVKNLVKADKDKVIVVHPAFFKYVHETWAEGQGRYPSTGMLAIIFALHICDEVSVFGYGADSQGNWHHYWEKNRYAGAFRKTGVHNADTETKIIEKLHAVGKIKLWRNPQESLI